MTTVLFAAAPAGADCAALPTPSAGMEMAAVVFVGTVVELGNGGRYATFAVEEQWKGSVAGEVEVRGGPPPPSMSSVERTYDLGARYLVTAFEGDSYTGDDVLSDNACSGTTPWDESLTQLRPADATVVERDQPILPRTNDSAPPYLMIALTTILVAGGCLYLLLRRGSMAYRARLDEEPPSNA
jgi:hypothetical protein